MCRHMVGLTMENCQHGAARSQFSIPANQILRMTFADLVGQTFSSTLQQELQRVNAFYVEQEQTLEVRFACHA